MPVLLFAAPGYPKEAWLPALRANVPECEIRDWPEIGDAREIDYILTWAPKPGLIASLPNLKLIFSIASGVGHILADPHLPSHIPIVRMVDPNQAKMMAEYATMAVLGCHRDLPHYLAAQARAEWKPKRPRDTRDYNVGVLGMGASGQAIAESLGKFGFQLEGWSRTPRAIPGVRMHCGPDGLRDLLPACHYLVCALPLTELTRGLLDRESLALMRPGAFLINLGRGEHVVEADLIEALDRGHLAGAWLDVFVSEPLPADHPYWRHPRILLTPHVAGELVARTATEALARHVRRHLAGESPLNLYRRELGY